MSECHGPADALARIAGWEGARSLRLDGGRGGGTYLVEKHGHRGVLKVESGPRTFPYIPRHLEAQVQMKAWHAGLANRVLYRDDTVYLTEYIEGRVWNQADFADDERLSELGAAVKQIHGLPRTGRDFQGSAAARLYWTGIPEAQRAEAARCLAIVESMPGPEARCLCHNDLVAGNILLTPGVRILDWEYACDNDPYFDLATLVAHHRLGRERSRLLLRAYHGSGGGADDDRLNAYCRYYDALLWLWENTEAL